MLRAGWELGTATGLSPDTPPTVPCSCWLSLEGGLLYAFVGPAAVIVLVSCPRALDTPQNPPGVGEGGEWQLLPRAGGSVPALSAPSHR